MGTQKGFTGQYNDALSGLDYYNARYYDPVVGRFISADTVQSNAQGADPYAYVGGNLETLNDPTGQCPWCIIGGIVGVVAGAAIDYGWQVYQNYQHGSSNPWTNVNWMQVGGAAVAGGLIGLTMGAAATYVAGAGAAAAASATATEAGGAALGGAETTAAASTVSTSVEATAASTETAAATATETTAATASETTAATSTAETTASAGAETATTTGTDATAAGTDGAASSGSSANAATSDANATASNSVSSDTSSSGACSFTPTTSVATAQGEQPIGSLQIGKQVWAYNSQTQKMELQPILHVWIHPDNDLVDLTIASTTPAKGGHPAQHSSEVVHTNQKHPFLTTEKGFLPVGQIKVGMHVVKADGSIGVITGWKSVPGSQVMYNLEVAHDHTFTVGEGMWVVHNCGGSNTGNSSSDLYPSRNAAFRGAKQDAGIPMGQQPDSVDSVKMTDRNGHAILDENGGVINTREYTYTRSDGNRIVIQDHSAGHTFGEDGVGDQGPHFNVRPWDDTRNGEVPGTKPHYSWGP